MEGSSSTLLKFHQPFPLHSPPISFLSLNLKSKTPPSLIVKAELQDSNDGSTSNDAKKPTGFGSRSVSAEPTKIKKKRGKEKSNVIRRSPIERPPLLYKEEGGDPQREELSLNENAFLLTWLGLGLLIFVEGIALAASGFLHEEWDNFFVKYLYPSFTPTVFLFVGGTVVYGVVKYILVHILSVCLYAISFILSKRFYCI